MIYVTYRNVRQTAHFFVCEKEYDILQVRRILVHDSTYFEVLTTSYLAT